MWFIGVEVEQETGAPPPKKKRGSAPVNSIVCLAPSLTLPWKKTPPSYWKYPGSPIKSQPL